MLNHLDKCSALRIVVLDDRNEELSSTYLGSNKGDDLTLKYIIVRNHLFDAKKEVNEELKNRELIKDYREYKEMEKKFNALPQDVKDKLSALEKM